MTKQNNETEDRIKLIIPAHVEQKLHDYVRAVNTEIAGMGEIHIDENGDVVVDDVAIYEQEVTGATADLSSRSLAKFQTELIRAGKSPSNWKLWWHSHVNMQAYFSGTDTATIDRSTEFPWMISLVVNKRREREARLDMYDPFRLIHELTIVTPGTVEPEINADIILEVAQKVKVKTYAPPMAPTRPIGFQQTGHALVRVEESDMNYGYGDGFFGSHDATYDAEVAYEVKKALGGDDIEADSRDIVNADDYDTDEILAIIKHLDEELRDYESNGWIDSPSYRETEETMSAWYAELKSRRDIINLGNK